MESNTKKIKITMDGKEIFPEEGMSILAAARQNQIRIPTLCHHPDLSAFGGCRLCMVEVDGAPRLVASCVTPVRDGMEIITSNEKIIHSRRTILEFLFAERNHNCMICPDSGDCELQSLAYELQMDHLTVPSSFDSFPMDVTSPYLSLDHNRCILCGRCVRACREISGARVLNFIHRGPNSRIGFDFDDTRGESTCHACGVCLQTCPTGAVVNRYRTHYSVKGHDKRQWRKTESCCPLCGLLCAVTATTADNTLLKIEGNLVKDTDRPDGGQLCFKGRFEVLKTKGERLTCPMVRNHDGNLEKTDFQTAMDLVSEKFNTIRDTHGKDAVLGLVSSMCNNETLGQFKDLMVRGWHSGAIDTLDGDHFRTLLKTRRHLPGSFDEASWKTIPDSDFILIAGASPGRTHPVINSLIHKTILEKNIKVAVIGNSNPGLPMTSFFLPITREQEPLLIKAMLKHTVEIIGSPAQKAPDWNRICKETDLIDSAKLLNDSGLDKAAKMQFQEMVKAYATAVTPLIVTGEGLTGTNDPSGLDDLLDLAMLKTYPSATRPGIILLKPFGNSAGAWQTGIPSIEPLSGPVNWKGGLFILSGEEDEAHILSGPASAVDFLAVISPFFPDPLARRADILIPAPTWMEEDGTYTSLDGRQTLLKPKLYDPPSHIQHMQDILSSLAEKAGWIPA